MQSEALIGQSEWEQLAGKLADNIYNISFDRNI